ncbi:MAG: hypothetical protein V1733_05760 [bacterium]
MQYKICFFSLVCFPLLTFAQQGKITGFTDKPLRIEVAAQSDKETYRIIPCGEKGMILFYKSVETAGETSARWYFSFYDQHLQQIWIKSAPIISSLDFKATELTSDTVNLFFEADRKAKNNEINFQILRILIPQGAFILNNGKSPESSTMAFFRVESQKAFIGLNTSENDQVRVMVLDLPTGNVHLFPVGEDGKSTLIYMTVDTSDQVVKSLITKRISKRQTELSLIKQMKDGELVYETHISDYNSGRAFNNAREIRLIKDETLVAGTYTQGLSSKKGSSDETTGFFTSPVVTSIQTSINFYNFLDLKNIRLLLDERDVLNLRKKSMKKNRSDQEYSLDFSILLHDLLYWKGEYILVAETYFPQFHTESFTDYDFYGRPFTNSYSVFDGYRFTGVMVVSFDDQGKLLWDNSMEIRNILTFSLSPKVVLHFNSDEIVMTYLSEGKIASRIIKRNEIIEKTTYSELELSSPNDKLLSETLSQMVFWYDNYFLCSGYQEIRDISKGSNDKRLVFFCNKVRFER